MDVGAISNAIAQKSPISERAWRNARDFEAQFLKSILEQAYAGMSGEGPLGGGGIGAEAWRSFLIEAQAESMSHSGGIGLASRIYRDITGQELARE